MCVTFLLPPDIKGLISSCQMLIKVTVRKIWENSMVIKQIYFFPKLSLIRVFDEKNLAQNNSIKS